MPGPLASLCWPASSIMYIYPNKVILNHHSYEHLGMPLAWLGKRWPDYRKVQGSSLCTLHICMVFYIFSWANHIFYKDYDIIGKLWTYHNDYTRCYIKDLTYDIIVNIIVNIIYDIIGMILIMISYVKIWYHSKYQTYDIIVLLWYHNRLWYHMFGL